MPQTASDIIATAYGVRLTPKPLKIVDFIFDHPGLSQKQLACEFYPHKDIDGASGLIRVYVNKLNSLLSATPVRIRSRQKRGYCVEGIPEH